LSQNQSYFNNSAAATISINLMLFGLLIYRTKHLSYKLNKKKKPINCWLQMLHHFGQFKLANQLKTATLKTTHALSIS